MDTNAVIELINGSLPPVAEAWLEKRPGASVHHVSVITPIELFSKIISPHMTGILKGFVQSTDVIGLNKRIIQQTKRLRQQRRTKLPEPSWPPPP